MKKIIYTIYMLIFFQVVSAQSNPQYPESFKALYSTIFNGDTIAVMELPNVSVVRYKFDNTRERSLYESTKRKVEKIKPYYDIALKVMNDLEEKENEASKRDFNKYKKNTKKELMNKFEKELRDLTMSEGKILVKMINRNTGSSFNDLIREYNNPIKVWGYNIVASRYGYDLKEVYDPKLEENKYIEMVLKAKGY